MEIKQYFARYGGPKMKIGEAKIIALSSPHGLFL
jgi:hypothetical protein